MIDSNNVIDRLKTYCSKNPDVVSSGKIKGINSPDNLIVVEVNGETKHITIDELEKGNWINGVFEEVVNTPEVVEELEVMEDNEDIETIETMDNVTVNNTELSINNLKDMKDASISKNEALINKGLETFAIDDKTGAININKAIKIVTDNSTNNVVECIKNNTNLPDDLSSYDLTGKALTSFIPSADKVDLQKLIDKSFENILVYVEVARLKNIIYNEAQIEAAKNKYATAVHDKLNVLGLNKKEEESTSSDDSQAGAQVSEESKVQDIKPDTDLKKAGFADILILTVIILIYAAIIINLISKLR